MGNKPDVISSDMEKVPVLVNTICALVWHVFTKSLYSDRVINRG